MHSLQGINAQLKRTKQKQDIGAADYHVMQNYSDSNQTSQDSGDKPYIDIEVNDKYIIREFSENINPIELMWHRDDEDRTIEIIGDTNWSIQLDNQLPSSHINDRYIFTRKTIINKFSGSINTGNTSSYDYYFFHLLF